jgi:hypothetical protein
VDGSAADPAAADGGAANWLDAAEPPTAPQGDEENARCERSADRPRCHLDALPRAQNDTLPLARAKSSRPRSGVCLTQAAVIELSASACGTARRLRADTQAVGSAIPGA